MQNAVEPVSLLLHGGYVLLDGCMQPQPCDVAIGPDGYITRIGPALQVEIGTPVAELAGRLVVPGLVDMHQHLDKTRTRGIVSNSESTLAGAIHAYDQYARALAPRDIIDRAERTIFACLSRGTVAIRTHANIGPDYALRGIEAMSALRDRFAGRLDLQIVALVPARSDWRRSGREWIDSALVAGADAIGGAPALADEPEAFLAFLFDAAQHWGIGLDLHLDEHLDPVRHCFHTVIALTEASGMQGRVIAGHCSALSAMAEVEVQPIIEGFARNRIGVVTLPTSNLYLLGREAPRLPPRGLTRARALSRGGVMVAIASDNIQDPFVPTGTGDLLELARWTMLAGHFDDRDFATAFRMISETPARMMERARHGIRVGASADLMIVDAVDIADLIASGPMDRSVLVAGKLVAGTLTTAPVGRV